MELGRCKVINDQILVHTLASFGGDEEDGEGRRRGRHSRLLREPGTVCVMGGWDEV